MAVMCFFRKEFCNKQHDRENKIVTKLKALILYASHSLMLLSEISDTCKWSCTCIKVLPCYVTVFMILTILHIIVLPVHIHFLRAAQNMEAASIACTVVFYWGRQWCFYKVKGPLFMLVDHFGCRPLIAARTGYNRKLVL